MSTPSGGSTPISGRYGRFQINGSTANVEQFSGELSTERIEATSFEDQAPDTGRISQIVTDGVDKIVANVKGYVDFDNLPYGAYNITPGADLANVYLFLVKNEFLSAKARANNAYAIYMPWAKVFRVNYVVQIHDKVVFDCVIESNGPEFDVDEEPSDSQITNFEMLRFLRDVQDLPPFFAHE